MTPRLEDLSDAELEAIVRGETAPQAPEAVPRTPGRPRITVTPRQERRLEDMSDDELRAIAGEPARQRLNEPGRPAFEAVGGTLGSLVGGLGGGVVGLPGGPPATVGGALAGGVAGGALGTYAGSAAYDLYRDARRMLLGDEGSTPPSAWERFETPAKAATVDALVGGAIAGAPAVGAAWRGLQRSLLGVTDPISSLTSRYKLTPGEARVARGLAEGRTLQEIRQLYSLPSEVLNSQYRGVLAKTRSRDERDVARVVEGVGPSSRETVAQAEQHGVPLGLVDVADPMSRFGQTARGYVSTMSRMPWIGKPAHRARAEKVDQIARLWDETLGALGPNRDQVAIGEELGERAGAAYDAFRGTVRNRYTNARALAEAEGLSVDPTRIIDTTRNIRAELMRDRPWMVNPQTGVTERVPSQVPEVLDRYLQNLENLLPRNLSLRELDAIQRDADAMLDRLRRESGFNWHNADQLRRAIRDTLRDAAQGGSPAAQAWRDADEFFSRGMQTFETPTAKRFLRTDRGMFSPGMDKPGTLNTDELYNVMLNARSPRAIEDLERVVGRDAVRMMARRRVDEAYNAAARDTDAGQRVFNIDNFARQLGLDDRGSAQYRTTARMLHSAGMDIHDFNRLLEVTRRAYGNEIPDVSTFVARRAVMGGAGSAAKAATGGLIGGSGAAGAAAGGAAGAAGGVALPIAGILLARYGMSILTNPKHLRNLLRLYDPNTSDNIKTQIYARLARQIGASGRGDQTPSGGEPVAAPPQTTPTLTPN